MHNITQYKLFTDQLVTCRKRADHTLLESIKALPFKDSNLVAAMCHGVLLGGKRLRPFLVYITGEMFGITRDNLDAPAAAIECIHAYSLMHDDLPVMDNDDLRRGQPSCHIKFGAANAILAGNALQALAFSILADLDMPDVDLHDRLAMLSELAYASGAAGICGGQYMDLGATGKQISITALDQIHHYKTAILIRAAIRLGALAAGKNGRDALPTLDRYASAIGLAFQIQDDILDVISETDTMSKRKGMDQQHHKNTYPNLLGFDKAKHKTQELYQEALTALNALSPQSYDTTLLQTLASFIIKRDN